jgi:hypothetical protein
MNTEAKYHDLEKENAKLRAELIQMRQRLDCIRAAITSNVNEAWMTMPVGSDTELGQKYFTVKKL